MNIYGYMKNFDVQFKKYFYLISKCCQKTNQKMTETKNGSFQLASIPQLIPGTQFPYSFSGQPIPGYYIPQPIAQAAAQAGLSQQTSYLQGLPAGYPIGNFGVSSYPQNYIG